jgi:hypothetical protein
MVDASYGVLGRPAAGTDHTPAGSALGNDLPAPAATASGSRRTPAVDGRTTVLDRWSELVLDRGTGTVPQRGVFFEPTATTGVAV